MLALPLILQGLSFIAALNALAIIAYDVREKMIPLYLIILFTSLSFVTAYLAHVDLKNLIIIAFISFLVLFYLVFKKKIGLADCFLLPSCFAWIELNEIPIFLTLCGFFGVVIAVLWRLKYQEIEHPFTPAILFSLSVVLVS